jgi:hypothetical protein
MSQAGQEIAELKVPANREYILAIKRLTASLGCCLGLSLDALDDLSIAMAQASEKTIGACDQIWGADNACLKVSFTTRADKLEIKIKGSPLHFCETDSIALSQENDLAHLQALHAKQIQKLISENLVLATSAPVFDKNFLPSEFEENFEDIPLDLGLNFLRLFVDDLKYRVNAGPSLQLVITKKIFRGE